MLKLSGSFNHFGGKNLKRIITFMIMMALMLSIGCNCFADPGANGEWCGWYYEKNTENGVTLKKFDGKIVAYRDEQGLWIEKFDNHGDVYVPAGFESDYLTVIGDDAFAGASGVVRLFLPYFVTRIGERAFCHCDNLDYILIPDSVRAIGAEAFADCKSLYNISLPASVQSIGNDAFSGCVNLRKLSIPYGVREIPDYLLSSCIMLEKISIPDSVESIGEGAFYFCMSLKELFIPASVEEISEGAFEGCVNLTLKVEKDSFAEEYAVRTGIPYIVV